MTEYERGFIDGIKSKVSAELTPTLINVSRTMLEMLKPVLSTALENALNDNNAITDTDVQPVKRGNWVQIGEQSAKCTECGGVLKSNGIDKTGKALIFNAVYHYCPNCGARMTKDGDTNDRV